MNFNTLSLVYFVAFSCSQPASSPIDTNDSHTLDVQRPSPSYDTAQSHPKGTHDTGPIEIPKCKKNDKVIHHTGYSFLYNESCEQANWVAYELTRAETNRVVKRSNNFCEDPDVETRTANKDDYKSSGYDRGHLAPAADMGWSLKAMNESFYFSNISPQNPSFNRGIWKQLEELVRLWAQENNSIYIVTGPILSNKLPSIGPNKVVVPDYFYKVLVDYSLPEIKGIGFIIPNKGSSESLQKYVVSIDSVEHMTSIDFFPLLTDVDEEFIEAQSCIPCWTWAKPSRPKQPNQNYSAQCLATTKAGLRCKRLTKNETQRCYQHTNF